MEKDELLLGLRAFYKYTLLPAEVRDVVGVLDLPGLVTGPVGYLVFLYLLVVWCFFFSGVLGIRRGVCECVCVCVCVCVCLCV